MDDNGKVLKETRFLSRRLALRRFLKEYAGAKVAIEASGMWEWAYDEATAAKTTPFLTHPMKTRLIAQAKIKTDKIDARVLADLLRGGYLVEAYAPPHELRELRKKLQARKNIVGERTRFKNQVHGYLLQNNLQSPTDSLFTQKGVAWLHTLESDRVERCLRIINVLDEEIDAIDKELATIAESKEETKLLMTIPGMGAYSSIVLYAWICDIERFPTPEALANYAGLVPRISNSGDSKKHGHITKTGPSLMRYVTVQAAWVHVRLCPESSISRMFHRLKKKKGFKIAIVAAGRKLIVTSHAMLTNKTPFTVHRPEASS